MKWFAITTNSPKISPGKWRLLKLVIWKRKGIEEQSKQGVNDDTLY